MSNVNRAQYSQLNTFKEDLVEIKVEQGGIQAVTADAIIINLFRGITEPAGATGVVDQALNGAISDLIAGGDLRGKLGETAVLYPRGAIPAHRVIVVGLGEADNFTLESVREASAVAIKQARRLGAASVATIVHGGGIGGLDIGEAAQAVVEGSLLALYRYDAPRAKTEGEDQRQVDLLRLVEYDSAKIGLLEDGSAAGRAIADATYRARTLVNQPSNVATPTALADVARAMCAAVGMTCHVLDEAEMGKQHMGLLLAVTQGATQPAQFIIIEYKPAASAVSATGPVILVGKGVAFDTGGYSLKPSASMVGMKGDMGGAAAVIGAMEAVARLKLPLQVVGLVPTVENVVSATSYKPNDVFIAKNGLSVEIISTDAEGRLILADALCYAGNLKPTAVIDVATLTGGKVIALGDRTNAAFVNDDQLSQVLLSAGDKCGEPLWRMPLDPAYDKQLKSEVADLKNTGGRSASSVTAARFLAHFVGDWPWAHLDIAGSEWYSEGPDQTSRSYLTKGGTAIPLRTLVECLRRWGE
jgi:leucyl aminopeptidase